MASPQIPLCVDLDGTLLRSDLLLESFLGLAGRRPLEALKWPFWLLRGRAYLKTRLSETVAIDAASLPYDQRLLGLLRRERALGRRLVLATASPRKYAEAIAGHLAIFDDVVATGESRNLKGENKRAALVLSYGERGFDYVGNSAADEAVWRSARRAWVVNGGRGLVARARAVTEVEEVLPAQASGVFTWLRALRVHQWLKNVLIFVPLVMAHRVAEPQLLWQTIVAFAAFNLTASSVYLLNDLLDLEVDRGHPRKRARPFAAGDIPLAYGIAAFPVLLALAALLVAVTASAAFALTLVGYYVVTLAYSLWLKQIVLVDVVTLAGLYTLRIFAGAAVMGTPPSFWLLAFSVFLFLSLALVKRYSEMRVLRKTGKESAPGRGYRGEDLALLTSVGTASGFAAVVVAALYINSPDVSKLYGSPEWLWLICPLLLYWISRVWLLANRGEVHDDPVVFALRDHGSQIVGVLALVTIFLAT